MSWVVWVLGFCPAAFHFNPGEVGQQVGMGVLPAAECRGEGQPAEPVGPLRTFPRDGLPLTSPRQSMEDLLLLARAMRRLGANNQQNVCLCCGLPCGLKALSTQECLAGGGSVSGLEMVCWFIDSTDIC